MKSFKQFLAEQPTNSIGDGGYTNAANVSGPVAGADPRLFPAGIDDLTQDYQTPAEPGMAKWRFSNVYPVMKLSLSKSSDGPSIDSMVAASKMFVDRMDESNYQRVRKTFGQFQEGWSNKYKKRLIALTLRIFPKSTLCRS